MKPILRYLPLATMLVAATASADGTPVEQSLLAIQHQWAHINYQLPADKQAKAFAALDQQEQALIKRYPKQAGPLIWHGIILSSLAGAKGGLGALHLAKEARNQLEASLKIDPNALQGSADASLGTLYYKVPGWPLGFGDDKKAEAYLKKALQIDPDGVVANYFYADFLYGQGHYQQALKVARKALKAPARPDRPLADKGRHQEVVALLAKIKHKIGPTASATRE